MREKKSETGGRKRKEKREILGSHPLGHDTHQKLAKNGLAQIGFGQKWIGQNWIGQNWSNQDGQNGIGQSRSFPKGRPHSHRYGKLPENKEYHLAHNLKKRCKKKVYKGIHDRFLRDDAFRVRMIQHNRDEEVCRAWDALAEQDHTCRMSEAEYFHYRQNWWISLNKSGNDTQPVRKRSHFNQALSTLNRLHQEGGGQQLGPMPHWKYKQRQPSSSSSSSWWQWRESWWSSKEFKECQERGGKVCDRTGQPVVHRTLAKTSDKWLS